MFIFRRAIRFDEVDAAGILFFARYLNFCHEAMESFFEGVDGGYAGLVARDHRGFPAVRAEVDFEAPVRYGDAVRIELTIEHVGNTSCTFRYRMLKEGDDALIATIRHVCVYCDLVTVTKLPFRDDVRAHLEKHRATDVENL